MDCSDSEFMMMLMIIVIFSLQVTTINQNEKINLDAKTLNLLQQLSIFQLKANGERVVVFLKTLLISRTVSQLTN